MANRNSDFRESLMGAKQAYVVDPSSLEPALSDITGHKSPAAEKARQALYKPAPMSPDNARILNYRRNAAIGNSKSLLEAVNSAPKNSWHLYRGVEAGVKHDEAPFASYSTDESVAREFAGENGTVHKVAKGTVQALQVPNQYGEKEYLVKHSSHPYWKGQK